VTNEGSFIKLVKDPPYRVIKCLSLFYFKQGKSLIDGSEAVELLKLEARPDALLDLLVYDWQTDNSLTSSILYRKLQVQVETHHILIATSHVNCVY